MQLQSFVAGSWRAGSGEVAALRDATTGAVIAGASALGGLTAQAHARVRAQRGRPGAARAHLPRARRAAQGAGEVARRAQGGVLPLSYATGATKADSWVDIDGGISTLFVYASKGTRELPNSRVYVDGARRGALQGRHLRRPAHLRAAGGRRGAHQRLQLSRVGHAREAGARAARRGAGHRQAGHRRPATSPSACSGASSTSGTAAGRGRAADLRRGRGPVRAPAPARTWCRSPARPAPR